MKLNSINIPNQALASRSNDNVNSQAKQIDITQVTESAVDNPTNASSHMHAKSSDELDVAPNESKMDASKKSQTEDSNTGEDLSEELEKYRKMLRFGVHESAVRQKMILEGEDPARLNL